MDCINLVPLCKKNRVQDDPKTRQDASQHGPRRSLDARDAPRCPQDDPKTPPRCAKNVPKTAQEGPWTLQDALEKAQGCFKFLQDASRSFQDAPQRLWTSILVPLGLNFVGFLIYLE